MFLNLDSFFSSFQLKGTKTRRAASPESEPNFYAMTPMSSNAHACPPKAATSWPPLGRRASLEGHSGPTPLTLQKIVPSIISPVSFETTVELVPSERPSREQRLMVKSTCSVTLKSNEHIGGIGTLQSPQFPLIPAALSFNRSQQSLASANMSGGHEAFWAAFGNGRAMSLFRNKAEPAGSVGNCNAPAPARASC